MREIFSDNIVNGDDICVVIPTAGKRIEFLHRAIQSVLNQTIQCTEIIVVWDSNQPVHNSLDFGNRIKIVRNVSRKKGVAGARNTGILETNRGYIALLDDDDFWLPEKIEAYLNYINTGSRESFYVSRARYEDQNGTPIGVFPLKKLRAGQSFSSYLNRNLHLRRNRISIATSSYVFPRAGINGLNLFNEEIFLAEDILLLLTMDKKMSFKIVGDIPYSVTTIYKDVVGGLSLRMIEFDKWIELMNRYFSFLPAREYQNLILFFGSKQFRNSNNFFNTFRWTFGRLKSKADLRTKLSTLIWIILDQLVRFLKKH